MPEGGAGAQLLAEIFPGQAGSADAILDGWGPPEATHRWTVGTESKCRLPGVALGPEIVLVLDVKPYCDADCQSQTVMLAIDGRLLATIHLADQRALGFRLPVGLAAGEGHTLSFTHLNSRLARAPAGCDRAGQPLGLMVVSLRLYRLQNIPGRSETLSAQPGTIADGKLPAAVQRLAGLPMADFAGRFECLGHNCEIGLVQRALGAEPLGLLRFAGVVTHRLADGLRHGFSGVGAASSTQIFMGEGTPREFKVYEERYYLFYLAELPQDTTAEELHKQHCRRLSLLQRKLVEDLEAGEKIFTVSRAETMTEPEALALFCALNLHARNTLLWTTASDPVEAGQVEQLAPGFLRGYLGPVDAEHLYASHDAWLSVMVNAYVLKR